MEKLAECVDSSDPSPSFIDGSVGHKGRNSRADVMIIQQVLNTHLSTPYRLLTVNGVVDDLTVDAIKRFQGEFMSLPDGRIDPFDKTVKKPWPVKYANPTGQSPRPNDLYGEGHHGASRGSRTHEHYREHAGVTGNTRVGVRRLPCSTRPSPAGRGMR